MKFEQVSSTVRSNTSWVMITWDLPCGQNDGQTRLKTLPFRNFDGGRYPVTLSSLSNRTSKSQNHPLCDVIFYCVQKAQLSFSLRGPH